MVRGDSSITTSPGRVVVDQRSGRTVINWQGFSIDNGEVTQFRQPSSDAIALNRVVGPDVSKIEGSLEANGNVWLVNQNGVMIGPNARVQVNGFLATTTDIDDDDFMAGQHDFDRPSPNPNARVVNQGSISLGEHGLGALVAPHARNDGVIQGRMSSVVIAGARTYAVDFYGDGLINFDITSRVEQAPEGVGALAENQGSILVDGGQVLITADAAAGIVEDAVNVGGLVQARSFSEQTGEIVLQGGEQGRVRVTGTLDVAGAEPGAGGGTVELRGARIAVEGTAVVDASGPAGGGEVLIGGDRHGAGPGRNAEEVEVAPGARILADATVQGDGGTVVVFADGGLEFHGAVSARGGPEGGDGGFVETSGATLKVGPDALVDASAVAGAPGVWLIDPEDLVISDAPGADVLVSTIVASLEDGSDVTIETDDSGAGAGDISVEASIQPDLLTSFGQQDVKLTLDADGAIAIDAGVVIEAVSVGPTDRFSVDLIAGNSVTNQGTIDLSQGDGDLSITAGSGIDSSAGALIVGGSAQFNGGSGAIDLTHADNDFGGPVSLANSEANPVSLRGIAAIDLGPSTVGGDLTVIALGAITDSGPLTVAGVAAFETRNDAGAAIELDEGAQFGTLSGHTLDALGTSTVAGGILVVEADEMNIQSVNTSGAVTLAATQFTAVGLAKIEGDPSDLSLTTTAMDVGIGLPEIELTGNLAVQVDGPITQTGRLNIRGTSRFAAGSHPITLNDSDNAFGQAVAVETTGAVVLTASGAIDLAAGTAGSLDVLALAGGSITDTGALGVTGPASFETHSDAGAAILLDHGHQFGSLSAQTLDDMGAGLAPGAIEVVQTNAMQIAGVRTSGAVALTASQFNAGGFGLIEGASGLGLTATAAGFGIDLPALALPGGLAVSARGPITQAGALVVAGDASFDAGDYSITLDRDEGMGPVNQFGGAVALANEGPNPVVLSNNGALELGASDLGGDLQVVALGEITQSGALVVGGTSRFDGGGAAIRLDRGDNDFTGAVSLDSTDDVALRDRDDLVLGDIDVVGDLTVIAGGDIGDAGLLTVSGVADFETRNNGGADILLDAGTARFGGLRVAALNAAGGAVAPGRIEVVEADAMAIREVRTGGTASLEAPDFPDGATTGLDEIDTARDLELTATAAGIELPALDLDGHLTVQAQGTITQAGNLTVDGPSLFDAGAHAITLDRPLNRFGGALRLRALGAGSVDLAASTGIAFGASEIGGDLDVVAQGAITQSGALAVGGAASFDAGAGAIDLDLADGMGNPLNQFAGEVRLRNSAAAAAAIGDSGDMLLGASDLGGDLRVVAGGSIDDVGALEVGGVASFETRAGDGAWIRLDSGARLGGLAAYTLDAAGATADGTIDVVALDPMAVTGMRTRGTATLQAPAFTGVAIDEAGTLDLTATAAGIAFTGLATTGDLLVQAQGAITQTGPLTVGGASRFDAGSHPITLGLVTNAFGGTLTLVTSGAAAIGAGGAVDFGASTVGGDFDVTAGAGITQSGPLTVGGASSLDAGAGGIALNHAGNDLGGPISLNNQGANDVSLRNNGGIELGASTIGGDLEVLAFGGIGDQGAVRVTGAASFETHSDAGVAIVLDNDGRFGSLRAVTLDAAGVATAAGAIEVVETDAMRITDLRTRGPATLSATAFPREPGVVGLDRIAEITVLDLTATAAGVALGALDLSELRVQAQGPITQTGALTVDGPSLFDAAAITLTDPLNDFRGMISFGNGSNTVAITGAGAILLGAGSVGGDLTLIAGGDIRDAGTLTVGGRASFETRVAAGGAIVLDDAPQFGSLRALTLDAAGIATANGAIQITEDGAMVIDGLRTAGTATLQATELAGLDQIDEAGSLVLTATAAGVDLPGLVLAGDLTVSAQGAIEQTAALGVAGMSRFDAGEHPITLDDPGNAFGLGLSVQTTGPDNPVVVAGAGDLVFAASSVGGGLEVTAGGAIGQTGPLAVGGVSRFAAGGGIDLDLRDGLGAPVNAFAGPVSVVTPGAVRIAGSNGILLGESDVGGDLQVVAGGSIGDLGPSSVGGLANFETRSDAGASILLDNEDNAFGSLRAVTLDADGLTAAGAISVVEADAMAIDEVRTSGTAVLQATNFTTGPSIGLGEVQEVTNLELRATMAGVDLPGFDLAGYLRVEAEGPITQSGALRVAGAGLFDAGAGAIALTNAANDFMGPVTLATEADAALSDANELLLTATSLGGHLTMSAGGQVTQNGPLTAAGLALLGTGPYLLTDDANQVDVLAAQTDGDVTYVDSDIDGLVIGTVGATVGASVGGDLSLTTAGPVTQTEAVTAASLLLLGTGPYILDDGNQVATLAADTTGDITYRDTGGFDIGAVGGTAGITTEGVFTLTADGEVTQSEAIRAPSLLVLGGAGPYVLTDPGNQVGTFAADTDADVAFTHGATYTVGIIGGTVGVRTGGNLTLTGEGLVVQIAPIRAVGLRVLEGGGPYILANADNDIDRFAADTTADIAYTDRGGFVIGAVGDTAGATTTGILSLTAGGPVTQTEALRARDLLLLGDGRFELTSSSNDIANLAANTGGDVALRDIGGFVIGEIYRTAGVTTGGDLTLTTAQGNVTQREPIEAPGLSLFGSGNYFLTDRGNDVDVLAARTSADIAFRDRDGFVIGAVAGNVGVRTSGTLTLSAGHTVTQTQVLEASELLLLGAGPYLLDREANDVDTLAARTTADIAFADIGGFDVGGVYRIAGVTTDGILSLTSGALVTQSEALAAPDLALLGTGPYDLTNDANNIDTFAASTTGDIAYTDSDGFVIDGIGETAGVTTGGNLTLSAGGEVSQLEPLAATGLLLEGTGPFLLTNGGNDVDTLAADADGDIAYTDVGGFAIGSVAGTDGATVDNGILALTAGAAVTQSEPLAVDELLLLGAGPYTLNNAANDIATLAAQTIAGIAYTDSNGFVIDRVAGTGIPDTSGITTGGILALTAGGPVTQDEPIDAPELLLLGMGPYGLTDGRNDIATLAADTSAEIAYTDVGGFAIGAIAGIAGVSTPILILTAGGAVTQTESIDADDLLLQGTGAYALTDGGNDVDILAASTSADIAYRDVGGFAIGSVIGGEGRVDGATTTGILTLTAGAAVTQSESVEANGLLLLGTGPYVLTDAGNDVDRLAARTTGDIAYRDSGGFVIDSIAGTTGVTTDGILTLTAGQAVTQQQPLDASGLLLLEGAGPYQLTHGGNDVDTLAAATLADIAYTDTGGFSIAAVAGTAGVTTPGFLALTAGGGVLQTEAIRVDELLLLGSGPFTLNNAANDIAVLAAQTTGGIAYGDTNGFAIDAVAGDAIPATAGVTTAGILTLTAGGPVIQDEAIDAPSLLLLGSGPYRLTDGRNDIDTLAGSTSAEIAYTDAGGFAIGAVAGTFGVTTTTLTLTAGGAVTQTEAIAARDLLLLGAGPYDLTAAGNDVDVLATDTSGGVAFRDIDGFAIGTVGGTSGASTTGLLTLSASGAVTQSDAIVAPGLLLLGDGPFALTDGDNDIDTLATDTGGDVAFTDRDGFDIGALAGGRGATTGGILALTAGGAVTQSEAIQAPDLLLLGDGPYALDNSGNDIDTLAAATTGDIAFRDSGGFAIGTIEGTAGIAVAGILTLTAGGSVSQTAAIDAPALLLLGSGAYALDGEGNDIDVLAADTSADLSLRDSGGFVIGRVAGGSGDTVGVTVTGVLTLIAGGAVTQTEAVRAPDLLLLGTGAYDLTHGGNDIDTLAADTSADIAFTDAGGFAIGTAGIGGAAFAGVRTSETLTLTAGDTVTQSQAIEARDLLLRGAGAYALTAAGNDIDTLAAGTTADIAFRDAGGFAIGSVGATAGVSTSGLLTLTAGGGVTQSAAILAPDLLLLGTGPYHLTAGGNDIATLAARTGGDIGFTDRGGFAIGTAGGTAGIVTSGILTLTAGGLVTQSQAIAAPGLLLLGAGSYRLTAGGNDIATLAARTDGDISVTDGGGFAIGTLAGTSGIATGGILTLSAGGSVTQSEGIEAPGLELLGNGPYRLTDGRNEVATLAAMTTADIAFSARGGFAIGAVGGSAGVTAGGSLTLTAGGVVTQSEAIEAPGLLLLGAGPYNLTDGGNAVATLAAQTSGDIAFRDSGGFAIGSVGGTAGIASPGLLDLTAGGTVSQSEPIAVGRLLLRGSGPYVLTDPGNDVATLAAATTADIAFTDAGGFAIGALGGTAGVTTTGVLTLSAGGRVTQSEALGVRDLLLLGTGPYSLADRGNDVATLAANTTGDISFRDTGAFTIGAVRGTAGVRTTGILTLSGGGRVTQTEAVAAPNLLLLGTGAYALTDGGNDVATLAAATGADIAYRDSGGFAIGTVAGTAGVATPGNLSLTAGLAVSQRAPLRAGGLELLGSGPYNLIAGGNDIGILALRTSGPISFTDADGFGIGTVGTTTGATTTGALTLTAGGSVTQGGAIEATDLLLLGSGPFNLPAGNNDVATLAAATTGDITFRDAGGFAIGSVGGVAGVSTTGNLSLTAGGTVTQRQAVTAPGLLLRGSGPYRLDNGANDIRVLAAATGADVAVTDVSGLTIGSVGGTAGVSTGGVFTLTAGGAVTQTEAIAAPGLLLRGSGSFDLTGRSNDVATLAAATTSDIAFRDSGGFGIGTVGGTAGVSTTGILSLTAGGAVTQDASIAVPGLLLLGTGPYALIAGGNDIATLAAATTADIGFRDSGGFAIGTVGGTAGVTTTGILSLTAGGAVTQNAAIAAPELVLLGSGPYDLTAAGNDIATLAALTTGDIAWRDAGGFDIGRVEGGAAGLSTSGILTLTAGGAVTQSEAISAPALVLLGSGRYGLGDGRNDIATLAAATSADILFRDAGGFVIGSIGATVGIATPGSLTLTAGGGVTQTAAIAAPDLLLLGAGPYRLTAGNEVATLAAATTSDIAFSDRGGFAIGSVGGTAGVSTAGRLTLTAGGAVTQSEPIAAPDLLLLGTGPYGLTASGNEISTLAAGTSADIAFRDGSGFAIGALGDTAGVTTPGRLTLTTGGAVTQSEAIAAPDLLLLGSGPYALTDGGNDIATLAAATSADIALRDAGGFAIGSVGDTDGVSTTGVLTLITGGAVTQSAVVAAPGLQLLGTGPYDLTAGGNDIATLAAATTGDIAYTDAGGFVIGTVADAGAGTTSGIGTTGILTLRGGGAVTQTAAIGAPGLLLRGTGPYTLTAGDNDIATLAADTSADIAFHAAGTYAVGTVGDSTGVRTSGSAVGLSAGGDLALGADIAAVTGTVSLDAGGDVLDGGGLIRAAAAALRAGGAIDAALAVGTLAAQAGQGLSLRQDSESLRIGDLSLTIPGILDLTLSGVRSLDAGVELVTNGGDLRVDSAVGAASLARLDAAGLLRLDAQVSGGTLDLVGGIGILHTAAGDVVSAGTLSATAVTGDILMAEGTQYQAGGATALTAANNVELTRVIAPGNAIAVTATTGVIRDATVADGAGAENLVGGHLTLAAASGIGSASDSGYIDIDGEALDAATTGAGGIFIAASNALELGRERGLSTGAPGQHIEIWGAGNLTVAQPIVTQAGGDIRLVGNGAEVRVGGPMTAGGVATIEAAGVIGLDAEVSGSAVVLTGAAGVTTGDGGDVTSAGSLDVDAGAGELVMASGSSFQAQGRATLRADRDVRLGAVQSLGDAIHIDAGGSIGDNTAGDGAGNENLVARYLDLRAGSNIGRPGDQRGDIDTRAGVIDARALDGEIAIAETDSLQLGRDAPVTAGAGGDISVRAGGPLAVQTGVRTSRDGDILLTTTGGGSDIGIRGDVQTSTGDIEIRAGGNITQVADATLVTATDGEGTLALRAGGSIGTEEAPLLVDTAVLAAESGGDISIVQVEGIQGDLTIGATRGPEPLLGITARDGDIEVSTVGFGEPEDFGMLAIEEEVKVLGSGTIRLATEGNQSDIFVGSLIRSGGGTVTLSAGRRVISRYDLSGIFIEEQGSSIVSSIDATFGSYLVTSLAEAYGVPDYAALDEREILYLSGANEDLWGAPSSPDGEDARRRCCTEDGVCGCDR